MHENGWGAEGLELGDELNAVIVANTFKVNLSKIRLQYYTRHQEVTGVVVNEFPNVHRRFVRQLRAMLHAWAVYGLEDAEREFREKHDQRRTRNPDHAPPAFSRVVKGKLDFLKMVKGEADPIYRRLANQLHELDPQIVDHHPQPPGDTDSRWAYWADYYHKLVFQLVVKHDGKELGGTAFAWKRHALATTAHDLAGKIQISPPCPDGHDFVPGDFSFHAIGRKDVDLAAVRLPAGASAVHKDFPIRETSVRPG
ncbi:MAG: hypothetical protein IIC91_03000 [Chloroflexi bacterium]|nr:hypothetical protein [Chloroflexota bacterium]